MSKYIIDHFEGTCSNYNIGNISLLSGSKRTYKYALKLIKEYNITLYNSLSPQFYNPWHDDTCIIDYKNQKYLHICHSAIDYLFLLNERT